VELSKKSPDTLSEAKGLCTLKNAMQAVLSPILILLAALAWGLLHSLLATWGAKKRLLRRFTPHSHRWYRLLYNLAAGLTLLPVLALVALLPDRLLYTVPLPWAGLFVLGQVGAIVALAVGLLQTGVWSFLGLRQLVHPSREAPAELVTSGLYRYVRHPLYTAGLALIWLTPVMTLNVLALDLAFTAYIIVGARYEERKLQREFGQPYTDYCARTPMLIPRLQRGDHTPGPS
jgi:protein-S-isoprenylcysteine O-methyltransferase Ste14